MPKAETGSFDRFSRNPITFVDTPIKQNLHGLFTNRPDSQDPTRGRIQVFRGDRSNPEIKRTIFHEGLHSGLFGLTKDEDLQHKLINLFLGRSLIPTQEELETSRATRQNLESFINSPTPILSAPSRRQIKGLNIIDSILRAFQQTGEQNR